jgi:hypothetical protein
MEAHFGKFSIAYMAILVFIIEMLITAKKDLSIFIRLTTYGSAFIISLILFIIGFGIYGFASSSYQVVSPSVVVQPPTSDTDVRSIKAFNADFSPLAGALGIGYFLHTVSLPIVRNNANPKNNERDVFFGYLLVGFTYISVGVMGSIGFVGAYFTPYFKRKMTPEMEQNFMRFALFALLFCVFPLINHFLRSLVFQLFFRDKEIDTKIFFSVNTINLLIPTLITIFYPKIGSILGQVGAVAGLLIVYILPVITHLKKVRTEIEHPLLAKAIQEDQYEFR